MGLSFPVCQVIGLDRSPQSHLWSYGPGSRERSLPNKVSPPHGQRAPPRERNAHEKGRGRGPEPGRLLANEPSRNEVERRPAGRGRAFGQQRWQPARRPCWGCWGLWQGLGGGPS